MDEPRLLAFAVGPFMVGSFALAATLVGLAYCAARGRRDHLHDIARIFSVTSGLTALYLFCESAVYTGMLLQDQHWARTAYRIMAGVALPAGACYWLLARRLLVRRPFQGDRRLSAAVLGTGCAGGLATIAPAPYGLLGPLVLHADEAWVGPVHSPGTLVYGLLGGGMILYLLVTLLRGTLHRRRAGWPLFRVAGLIGCLTALHDLMRLLDVQLGRMPLLWVGLGLMLLVTFIILARQYAGLTVHVEGREDEIRRLRAEQIADPGSGTYSRRMLEDLLRKEVSRMARGAAPGGGVLLVRLANYEDIRKRLGDASTEGVVGDLADVLRQCIRESDSIGRWGRDRFLILVHAPGPEQARPVIDRIMAATDSSHYQPIAGVDVCLRTEFVVLPRQPRNGWQHVVSAAEHAVGPGL